MGAAFPTVPSFYKGSKICLEKYLKCSEDARRIYYVANSVSLNQREITSCFARKFNQRKKFTNFSVKVISKPTLLYMF